MVGRVHPRVAALSARGQPSHAGARSEGDEGGIRNPAPIVDDLLQHGLLLEFDPVDGSSDKLFPRYRLYPTRAGLGNRQDKPGVCQIGIGADPAIA